jgi:capsular exopolysaccharide synthesis family protein
MSKIFDALTKAGDDTSAILTSVFDGVTESRTAPELVMPTPEPEPPRAAAVPVEERMEHRVDAVRSAPVRVSAIAPVFPLDDAHPQAAEQYRIIRTKLLQHSAQPRTIVVSSPSSGDGKTVTAVNTAACLALKEGAKVLLIDADLRRSSIADLLGLPAEPGLADVLAGRCVAAEAVTRLEQLPNLSVLTAGRRCGNPAELLDSVQWRALIEACRKEYRYIVIDATPVAAVADYELVQVVCDGIVVVVRPDHTDRKLFEKTLATIPKAKLIGAVINCAENWFLWKTHGYGYYSGVR